MVGLAVARAVQTGAQPCRVLRAGLEQAVGERLDHQPVGHGERATHPEKLYERDGGQRALVDGGDQRVEIARSRRRHPRGRRVGLVGQQDVEVRRLPCWGRPRPTTTAGSTSAIASSAAVSVPSRPMTTTGRSASGPIDPSAAGRRQVVGGAGGVEHLGRPHRRRP